MAQKELEIFLAEFGEDDSQAGKARIEEIAESETAETGPRT